MSQRFNKAGKPIVGMRRGVALLPNLLTTANLFCGFFSITQSLKHNFDFAVWLIVLAGAFDFLDGRVARLTNTQSDFGVEYDSLSDLTTFCLAPAVLVYTWGVSDLGKLGLAACFLYFCCGALRLARFNVQAGSVEKTNFQGLPTPAAAGTLVSSILFYRNLFAAQPERPILFAALAGSLGLLMVSSVRYRSMKQARRRTNFIYFIAVVALITVIASQPEITLFPFGICYISLGLGEWIWQSPQKIRNLRDILDRLFSDKTDEPQTEDTGDFESKSETENTPSFLN